MSEPLVTAAVVAERLGFAAGTIVDWAEQGKIPYYKIGVHGRLRFRFSEIEAKLESDWRGSGPGRGGGVSPTPTTRPTLGVLSHSSPTPNRGGNHAG